MGMSGTRPPAPSPSLERDPRWGRRQHGAGFGASRDRGQRWTSVMRPRRRRFGYGSGPGWRATTRSCRRPRPMTSTGPVSVPGIKRSTTAVSSARPGRKRSVARACRASAMSSSTRNWPPPARRPGRVSVTSSKASSSTEAPTSDSGSSRGSSTGVIDGARVSASRTQARTWLHCAPGPNAGATSTSSPVTRCGRATPTTLSGAWCLPAPTLKLPSTEGSRRSRCRWISPGSSSGLSA